jgi:flagellar biosynthetic protein FliR
MLATVLPAELYAFMMVFVRVGAFLMLLPAIGEMMVPAGVRLAIALGIALVLAPVVGRLVPAMPDAPLALATAIGCELVAGLFMAGVMRMMLTSLHVAGTVIGLQSGMAFAMAYDPSQGQQSVLFSNFLTMVGLVLIFVSDLHLVMLRALADGYTLFPPGRLPPVGDFAEMAGKVVGDSFRLGIQISAPFIAFGILFNLGLGVLSRLMPAIQVFFIGLPPQILLNFLLLAASIGIGMTWFLAQYEDTLGRFLS